MRKWELVSEKLSFVNKSLSITRYLRLFFNRFPELTNQDLECSQTNQHQKNGNKKVSMEIDLRLFGSPTYILGNGEFISLPIDGFNLQVSHIDER